MCSCEQRQAAADVLARYTYALDDRWWALLDEVFTPDAVARYGDAQAQPLTGRTAIVASIRSFLAGCGPTQHLLGNHVITINGDTATATSKARVFHYGAGQRAALTPYECFGTYRDRLRRWPEGWRIYERIFDVHLTIGDHAILAPA